jgi:PKHD-type hydroxylase
MKNLVLPEIDLSQPPTLNDHKYSYWNLIDDTNHDYVCFENALSPTEVNEVIKIGRSFFVNQSLTADGTGHSDIRRSYNSWIPPCKVSNSLYVKLQKLVKDANEYFCYELHSLENLQYTEYDEEYSGHYDMHKDQFKASNFPNFHRKLSFSVQLTDPSLYEGGDLMLYSEKTPITTKKTLGTINFFPSYVLHQVTPITKGYRNCLVGWVSGPKFK